MAISTLKNKNKNYASSLLYGYRYHFNNFKFKYLPIKIIFCSTIVFQNSMADEPLSGLSIRVWLNPEQDVVLIYADPVLEDLKLLLASENDRLLEDVKSLIWDLAGTV